MPHRKPAGVRFETWIDRALVSAAVAGPAQEAHDVVEGIDRARTEAEVRERVGAINEKIRDAIRTGIRGPDANLVPLDVEGIVKDWRRGRRA